MHSMQALTRRIFTFFSLALHGTSVFRLNALQVIKWFFPPMNRWSMENAFLKMLAHNNYYIVLATCNHLHENYCVFHRTCRHVSHAVRNVCLTLCTCHLLPTNWQSITKLYSLMHLYISQLERTALFCSLLVKRKLVERLLVKRKNSRLFFLLTNIIAFYYILLKNSVMKMKR